MKNILIPLLTVLLIACADDPIPKPKAYLRLEYPEAKYKSVEFNLPFKFDKNSLADNIKDINVDLNRESFGFNINYPTLKGTLYMTYRRVNETNLSTLLRDAQNITQKHVGKADEISEQIFIDDHRRVFGTFYEVGGNTASQAQFYVTDSLNHFLNGSLYFYAKPNYDSIYPAAEYLKNDIKRIMETIEWKP